MRNVAITGGLGFIGHHLVNLFLEKKWNVTVIDDLSLHQDPYLTKYRMESIQSKKCEFLNTSCNTISYGDVRNKIRDSNIDVIVHLASIPNQAAVMNMPQSAVNSIVGCTLNVAMFAEELQCRLVHVSSSMAYGDFTCFPQDEDAVLSPTNLYGLLKAQSEDIVKLTSKNYMIIRPSAVYGPGDNSDRVIGKWLLAALQNRDLIVNDPSSLLDFTYVTDLARGIFAAATITNQRNETYNLTRGQARSLGEAAMLIKEITRSKSKVIYDTDPLKDHPIRGALDISKARQHLNYQPRVDLQDGLGSYTHWIKTFKNVD